jgi:hypothetical protein
MRRADCTQGNYRSGRKGVERSHGAPSSIKHPRHLRGLERLIPAASSSRTPPSRPRASPRSYNNGAGMSRLLTTAAYALHNLPLGTRFDSPILPQEQASRIGRRRRTSTKIF